MESIGTRLVGKAWPSGLLASYPRSGLRQESWSATARPASWVAAERGLPETRINISSNEDIVEARRTGSLLVMNMGFSGSRVTLVTTVISELAWNILLYASTGEIVLSRLNGGAQLNVTALDQGPGIENLPMVLAGGYSTSGGLGLGLCGLRRIVDEFEIKTHPGKGTQVFVGIHA
jgi:serine/threonine-protein kinase RsbT